jgi:hypothetical protein
MKPWLQTAACKDRAHCAACLAGNWHTLDGCPHGITAANLPTPKPPPPSQLDAALRSQARGEVYAPPGRCKGCGG